MSKFSQQDLESAFDQMSKDRDKDSNNANQAKNWIKGNIFGVYDCYVHESKTYPISPFVSQFSMVIRYGPYGPHKEDFIKLLDSQAWAEKTSSAWVRGLTPKEDWYKVKTPFGEYSLTFEYIDSYY